MLNLLRRIALQHDKGCSAVLSTQRKSSTLTFGHPGMPDKLYKTVKLEMRGCERAVMKSYESFITTAAKHLNITVGRVFSRNKPTFKRFTVLKSAFVHKKHMVQYEIRTHYTWVHLYNLTGSTADTFLEYIQRMLPESVALKVTKVSLEPLPDHLNPESLKQSVEKGSQGDELPLM